MVRLADSILTPPLPFDQDGAEQHFEEIVSETPDLADLAPSGSQAAALLRAVFGGSSFLTAVISRDPAGTAEDLNSDPEDRLDRLLRGVAADMGEATSLEEAGVVLRRGKERTARLIALADIAGVWNAEQVIEALSRTADGLVSCAVDWLLARAAGEGRIELNDGQTGYIVLAMGKHGAYELNYSSDIDLIVLFDPERAVLSAGTEPQRFFVRLTKDLVRLLQERTADGYVYRTDLRLRPDPGATNVAISVVAAATYYEAMGQNWERAAMIKARPIAGDIEAGEAFLKELAPFVWRKYLDFAAISDVHSIKRQIQAQRGHARIAVAGHNLKLGRGGIREIEFFVQTQQLIAGGRQTELRGRGTLDMLGRLTAAGWIDASVCDDLSAAYRVLRRVENRLQMVGDEQTHSLPKDDEALERFARFSGYAGRAEMEADLLHHMGTVERHYSALFEEAPSLGSDSGGLVFTGTDDDPATLETLAGMGFSDPALVSRTVRTWHYGRSNATRSAKARERLTELKPALLKAFSKSEHPDQALIAFDRFIAQLPAGVQLFSLLCAYPGLLYLIADIMGTAPRLADVLSKRPRNLEVIIEQAPDGCAMNARACATSAGDAISGAADLEEVLDRARAFGQEQMFRTGVQILAGLMPARDAGAAYSALAQGLIAVLLDAVQRDFARVHGEIPGGAIAIVGMGKLGSREMTATSDLDLILMYDSGQGSVESDGRRPLAPGPYYTRLTQRLISALSVPTAEGRLFEVDMRLRPSGRSGPLATRLSSFADYHEKSAWTWEQMALTRARVVAGNASISEAVNGIIQDVLRRERDPAATARDVADMRTRIAEEKGAGDIWALKHVRGGIIDIEFIVQYLQLVHAGRVPDILLTNTGDALDALAGHGLLTGTAADELREGYRLYQQLTQLLRLSIGAEGDPREASGGLKKRLARAGGAADFAELEDMLTQAQARVREHFAKIVERSAEAATETPDPAVKGDKAVAKRRPEKQGESR